jgi:sigma-54-interacting transcriptional regulator
MSAARGTDASPADRYDMEWRLLSEHRCNALLEGTITATDAALRLWRRHIRQPIVRHEPPAPLDLPSSETGALILTNVATLSQDEQQRLLAWMDNTGSRTHIISTSARPLFALVAAGLFDAALYYRLNVVLLHIATPFRPGLLHDGTEGARRLEGPIAISTPLV